MSKERNQIIEERMLVLLRQFETRLSKEIIDDNRDLVVHREWGVALENLCQQLFEFDVAVEADLLAEIKLLSEEMQLPPTAWSFLVR